MRKPWVWVGALAAGVAAALAVVMVTADHAETARGDASGSERPSADDPRAELERRELHAASAVAVEDEVWVFGGFSGPDGSTPPSTDLVPPGWKANDTVTVYAVDGTVRRRFQHEGLGQRALFGGRVVAVGDERYLLGGVCSGTVAVGCSGTVDPLLVRFDDDEAVQVPLQLPPAQLGGDAGAGFVAVLGPGVDGIVWVTQDIAGPSMLPVQPVRLLAIDVATGVGTDVPLPDGLVSQGTVCVHGGQLYATRAELGGSRVTRVQLLRRAATVGPGGWEQLITPDLDLARVSGGTLDCLPADELALTVRAHPRPFLFTYDLATRAAVHEPVDLSVDGGARMLGEVGDRTVLQVAVGREQTGFLLHRPGGSWLRSPTEISRTSVPIVVDGELRDAQSVVASTAPVRAQIPRIEIDIP